MDELKLLQEFPEYGVSRDGSVYNLATGYKLNPSRTRAGAVKVTISKDGRPHTRSLPLLVAQEWVYNDRDPEIFDTPIHLDNDITNNHADNLAWRPRWFAMKYQRQYWNESFRFNKTMVEDVQTGDVYDSIMQPCQRYGLLFMDVFDSCMKGTEVFPTRKIFSFV